MTYPTADDLATALASTSSGQGAALVAVEGGGTTQDFVDASDNGSASMAGITTAAALEALAATSPVLVGYAGATHGTDRTAYFRDVNIVGNGATLFTDRAISGDQPMRASTLAIGASHPLYTEALNAYDPVSIAGNQVELDPADAANCPVGSVIIVRGTINFSLGGSLGLVYRNTNRRVVLENDGSVLTVHKNFDAELLAEGASAITVRCDAEADTAWIDGFYFIAQKPHLRDLRVVSENWNPLLFGAAIGGRFSNLDLDGRSGIAANAMVDCTFDSIQIRAWYKLLEFAEQSYNSHVRGLTGSLYHVSGDENVGFVVGFGENSKECSSTYFDLDFGYATAAGAIAVLLPAGRDNFHAHGIFRMPNVTGSCIGITSRSEAGNSNLRSGVSDVVVFANAPLNFFYCGDSGAGVDGAYCIGSKFYGTPTNRAALCDGTNGRLIDNYFENGQVVLNGATCTGWQIEGNKINGSMTISAATNNRIESNEINGSLTIGGATSNRIVGNYIKDGFADLSDARLKVNTVSDNESDASRMLDAAAFVSTSISSVTTTTANTAYGTATFAAGDLNVGDKVFFNSAANTSASGTSTRNARVSVTSNGTTTGIGSAAIATAATPLGFEGWIRINSDTSIVYDFRLGSTRFHGQLAVSSIAANGLTVNLEYWVANSSEPINVREARIIPVKPGMKHLPIV